MDSDGEDKPEDVKLLRFFGDWAPKEWPLRGSSGGAVAVARGLLLRFDEPFAIRRRVRHARPIERSVQ